MTVVLVKMLNGKFCVWNPSTETVEDIVSTEQLRRISTQRPGTPPSLVIEGLDENVHCYNTIYRLPINDQGQFVMNDLLTPFSVKRYARRQNWFEKGLAVLLPFNI